MTKTPDRFTAWLVAWRVERALTRARREIDGMHRTESEGDK